MNGQWAALRKRIGGTRKRLKARLDTYDLSMIQHAIANYEGAKAPSFFMCWPENFLTFLRNTLFAPL